MTLILRAESKVGFINGSIKMPTISPMEHEKWMRAGSLVSSWILNSILKEFVEALLYTNSAKDL